MIDLEAHASRGQGYRGQGYRGQVYRGQDSHARIADTRLDMAGLRPILGLFSQLWQLKMTCRFVVKVGRGYFPATKTNSCYGCTSLQFRTQASFGDADQPNADPLRELQGNTLK